MIDRDAIDRLIQGFVAEATDRCAAITRDLLVLESGAGSDLSVPRENVARALHTLKGAGGTLGFEDLQLLAHHLEDVLGRGTGPLPAASVDVVLRGLDVFLFRLRAHAGGRGAGLQSIGELLLSAALSPAPAATEDAHRVGRAADRTIAAIGEALDQEPIPLLAGAAQTWRVDANQVIALMKEVERLRVLRLRLDARRDEIARALETPGDSTDTLESVERGLASDSREMLDIVSAVEEDVKRIGTQPMRVIVEPLHRAVRDLCRSAGKEARLSLVGGEVSLDRRMLDALKGPLVHLVSNAVDHGIEDPDTRRARGKHPEGAIVVRVEQHGNLVFLEVSDDGGGLDVNAIRRAALERGVATEAELTQMRPEKLHGLVFEPTVSTAQTITATSGRGIGMDVVRKSLEELRGHVEVESIPRQGTRVVMRFPAGLGSSPLLLVRVDDHEFGVPLLSVEAVLRATACGPNLRTEHDVTRLSRGERLLPVVDLGAALMLPGGPAPRDQLVVTHAAGRRVVIGVDEAVGDADLVIRPLPRELAQVPCYQGASVLARGDLVLILRPDWLAGLAAPD